MARCSAEHFPQELTTFVGRRRELAEAARLLRSARLITLTGVGGVGKTRLALQVAGSAGTGRFDHVCLADLTVVDTPGLVQAAVNEAVGIRDESGALTGSDLARQLAGRRTLIVLDNCEHVVDGCAALANTLLRGTPGVTLLATSRQPLGLPGEHILPVLPFASPQPGEHNDVAGLARCPAVALLSDRARAVVPGFEVTAENAGAIAAVCEALDGLPLALELAAVRLRALSPAQLFDWLERHPSVMSGTSRTAPARHRSLTALMDWSFRLCSDPEQILWARTSVFAGGFDLEAAEQVCTGDSVGEGDVADLIAGLVEKSILLREDHGPRIRYRLLETIRRYGRARLAESGEEQLMIRRHRQYLQRMASTAATCSFGPADMDWLDQLRFEHANLRAALENCARCPADAAAGLRLATTFWLMWRSAGWVGEGRQWLNRLLALVREPAPVVATALWVDGWLALIQGDLEDAVRSLRRSETISRSRGDRVALAFIDLFLGQAATLHGALGEAERRLRRALEVHRDTGDPAGLALTTFRLAVCQAAAGDAAAAMATAEEILRFCQDRGARWWSGYARWIRAVALWDHGEPEAAAQEAVASLTINWSYDDELGAAMALEIIAWATVRNDPPRAARILGALDHRWPRAGSALAGYRSLVGHHDACSAQAQRRLGSERFASARARGAWQGIGAVVEDVLHRQGANAKNAAAGQAGPPLTRRERQVAGLIRQGKTNKEIARELVISIRTAEAHVEHIRAKLGVSSRSQIAAWVAERHAAAPRSRQVPDRGLHLSAAVPGAVR